MSGPAEVPADEEPTQEQMAAWAAQMRMMQPPRQEWACVACLNTQKLMVAEMTQALEKGGIRQGTEEYGQAIGAALQLGQMVAMNPGMLAELPDGQKPPMIPPVRNATVMVQGTSLCAHCYVPQKQTSLVVASGNGIRR